MTGGQKLRVNNDVVDTLRNLYEGTPTLSVRHVAQYVPVSKSSVQRVLKKNLIFYPYKIRVVHALKPADLGKREEFTRTLLTEMNRDPAFLHKNIFFSDEATCYVSDMVNRHNIRIFSNEPTINQENFLNMLLQFVFPQVRDGQPGVIFQLDWPPPHWGLGVRRSLHTEFPGRWIGRGGPYS